MKPHVNLNHFSKDLLKVAACLAIGTAISAPVAYAEPLQATQSVQNGTVSGVVTDSQGEPIIGASVIVQRKGIGRTGNLHLVNRLQARHRHRGHLTAQHRA